MTANTSANPITPAFSNGTLAGNTEVSKLNVHGLLYSGHTTKVLVHWIPWFDGGLDSGINVNYSTSDPTYVNNMLTDLISRGVDGVIVDWMGQGNITDAGALVLQTKIQGRTSEQAVQMSFAIMCDEQLLGNTSGANNQAKLLNALAYLNTQYVGDPAYLHYNGKPLMFDFGLTAQSGIDWNAIQTAYPNLQWVHLDNATSPDGFGIPSSAGSFLWVNPNSNPNNTDLSTATDFYSRALTHTSQIAMGACYKGFNSNPYAPWDGNVYVNQQNGQTWLNLFGFINSNFSTSHQLPFLQLVTWDDYYEGTALETGISGGLTMTPAMQLNISGNVNSIYDLELWHSTDNGNTWNMAGVYPANTTVIPLSFGTGKYFVKVASQPFCSVVLSNQITVT